MRFYRETLYAGIVHIFLKILIVITFGSVCVRADLGPDRSFQAPAE